MTAKSKKAKPEPPKSNTMKVQSEPGESREAMNARLAVEPCMAAACVSATFARTFGDIDLAELHGAILDKTKRVHDGNLREVESTLTAQAVALNSIFTDMARRAAMNAGEYLGAAETYLKLALRAQSQCRATLETLAAIKNPPVVFAKQANIAHGHQQVNNGTPVAPARETEKPQTELLEHDHGEWLDTRAASAAGRSNPALAAVEAIHRPTHKGGQGQRQP